MYRSFQEKKNCQIIAKTYSWIMGIAFCCLITCRLHYPAGKATAEQFSSRKNISIGLKSKLFSITYTAQKTNVFFPPFGDSNHKQKKDAESFFIFFFTPSISTALCKDPWMLHMASAFEEKAKPDLSQNYTPPLPVLPAFQGGQSSSQKL